MADKTETPQAELPTIAPKLRKLGDAGIRTDATPIAELIGRPVALTHAEHSTSRQYGEGARMKVSEVDAAGAVNGKEHIVVTFSEGVVRVIRELLALEEKSSASFNPPFVITFRGSRETGYSVE